MSRFTDIIWAIALIVYGIFWLAKRKIRRWGGDLVILFFLVLQYFLQLFKGIAIRKP